MISMAETITCNILDEGVEQYKNLGYRLDMIFPADAPREALVSMGGKSVRLVSGPMSNVQCPTSQQTGDFGPETLDLGPTSEREWKVGRAGMEYRDLIPDRLGGKVIASHIRLTKGGEVPDYVHYHKVDFQMIYCRKGRIKVVYEDQGPPFWLETGDCVLQPPEIRHRVLECTAGAEVIEVTVPAEHETWVEHDMTLPTDTLNRERLFCGQRFVRLLAAGVPAEDTARCDDGVTTIEDQCRKIGAILANANDIAANSVQYCETFMKMLSAAVRRTATSVEED